MKDNLKEGEWKKNFKLGRLKFLIGKRVNHIIVGFGWFTGNQNEK